MNNTMNRRTTRHPKPSGIHRAVIDSAKVVFVPLADGREAKLSAFDFDRLLSAGHQPDGWYVGTDFKGNEVVMAPSRNLGRHTTFSISEAVYGLGHFEYLIHHNGDHLDLTRRNVWRKFDAEANAAYLFGRGFTPAPRVTA